MTHPNKRRGNDLETWVVKKAQAAGLQAKRAWGSDGRAMGEHTEVDVKIENFKLQCKKTKTLAGKYKPSKEVDGVVFAEDYGPKYVMIPFSDWLELVRAQGTADAAGCPEHPEDPV